MAEPEVFINYRTGDGEDAAALIQQFLENRFGEGHAFKASASIEPGEAYPSALTRAVRHSEVLLAIMGPDWARAAGLDDANDWVRRELLEARGSAVRVIPVLNGRMTNRLDIAGLPSDLTWLADVQSLRLDTKNRSDLDRIGDKLADLVPSLKTVDRAPRGAPVADGMTNTAGSAQRPVVQTRDVSGGVNVNNFGPVHGTLHAGKGDIYQNPQPLPKDDDPEDGDQ